MEHFKAMRFQRMQRYERFDWTPRKLQAFLQRGNRQRRKVDEAYPLLGGALLEPPAPAPDADAELAARRAANAAAEKRMRDLNAEHWRRGRALYFACDPDTRDAVRRAWNAWSGPANAQMFIYVVENQNGAHERRLRANRAADAELRERIRVEQTAQYEMLL